MNWPTLFLLLSHAPEYMSLIRLIKLRGKIRVHRTYRFLEIGSRILLKLFGSGLGHLAFRTTLQPPFPRCEVTKPFFVHRSPLLWPQESIETIEAISSNVVPMQTNYFTPYLTSYTLNFGINYRHSS